MHFSRTLLHRTIAAFALLVAYAGVHAQRVSDLARFQFGEVVQGAVVEHEFRIRNESAEPMRIAGVQLTPPLQLAKSPAVIPPGGTVALKIKLDTAKVEGEYEGHLIVTLSGATPGEREFSVVGKVTPTIQVLPLPAFFISTQKGAAKTANLEIVNREAEPLDLQIQKRPSEYDVKLEAVEPGRRFRLSLTVPANAPAGRRSERMELKTSSARKPVLFVGVNTIVRERVYTFPDSVDLGHLKLKELKPAGAAQGSQAQTLMVYQAGGKGFKVEARHDVPGLEVAVEPGPQGDRVQLTISLARNQAKPGPLRGTLVLRTNDPDFPELRVPVSGVVAAD